MERLLEIQALLADEAQVGLLTPEAVAELKAELQALYTEVRKGDDDGKLTAENIEALSLIADALDSIKTVEGVQAEAAEELAAKLAELDAKVAEPEPEPEVEVEPAEASDETPAPEAEVEPEPETAEEPELVTAATKPLPLARLNASIPARTRPRANPSQGNRLRATADGRLSIDQAGSELHNVREISQAIIDTDRSFVGSHSGPTRHVKVASVETDHYAADQTLDSTMSQAQILDRVQKASTPEAITAAICGPAEPRFEQMVITTSARPVRDALLRFGADRGAITFVPPIDISDIGISGGTPVQAIDVLTAAEMDTEIKPHQRIECGTPVTCSVVAVTNILEFGNMLQRTGSEQMDAFVQTSEAAHARVAETLLLTDIGTGSTSVTAGTIAVELGIFREAFRKILHIAANQRYAFRMPTTAPIRVLLPTWFGWAMVQDIIGASHSEQQLAEDVDLEWIAGKFRAYQINVTWTLDGVAGQTIPAQPVGSVVAFPGTAPGQVIYYMFPEGSWLFLDGGTLDLGLVRDSTLNATNSFQLFSETFEHACLVGPWSLDVTQTFCTSGASGGQVDPEDLCATGS